MLKRVTEPSSFTKQTSNTQYISDASCSHFRITGEKNLEYYAFCENYENKQSFRTPTRPQVTVSNK